MASQKDKDYHKLRNPEMYEGFNDMSGYLKPVSMEDAAAKKRYEMLHAKYGFKSMVCDKRRRNSTRKSNQKDKQILHQIERSRIKHDVKKHLDNKDYQIASKSVLSKGYLILN